MDRKKKDVILYLTAYYGMTKKNAMDYYKTMSEESKDDCIKALRNQSKFSFYND